MGKLIPVSVRKLNGVDISPAVTEWVSSDKIDGLRIGSSNGATFKYTPNYRALGDDYETSTAASAIAALGNA
jgi:hypothetical protein